MPAGSAFTNAARDSSGSFRAPPASGDAGLGSPALVKAGIGAPVNGTPVIGTQAFGPVTSNRDAANGDAFSDRAASANADAAMAASNLPADPMKPAEAPRAVCLPVSVEDFVAQIDTKALAPRFVCDPMLGEAHRVVAFANGLRSGSGLFGQKLVARALKTIPHFIVLENEVIGISRAAFEQVDDSGQLSGQLMPRARSNVDGRHDQRSRLSVDIVVYNRVTKDVYLIEVRRKSETLGFANERKNFSGRFVAAANCAQQHCKGIHGWQVKDVYYKVLDLKCRGGRSTMLMALHELNDFLGIDGADQVIKAGLSRIEAAVHNRFTAFVRGFVAAAVPAAGQVTGHAGDPATDQVTGVPETRGSDLVHVASMGETAGQPGVGAYGGVPHQAWDSPNVPVPVPVTEQTVDINAGSQSQSPWRDL
jgi:hypothetical protein